MMDNPVVTAAASGDARAELQVWLSDAQSAVPPPAAPEDRDQLARLRHPQRRQEWLLSRALLREQVTAGQRHSLSHSGGHAALLTTADEVAIGVDLELHRPRPWLRHAELVFSPAEVAAMRQAPATRQPALFLALWTMKEALAKALGLDLMQALLHCRFQPDDGDCWAGQAPTQRPWYVEVFTPRPGLTLAIACVGSSHPRLQTWLWPRCESARWPTFARSCTPSPTIRCCA